MEYLGGGSALDLVSKLCMIFVIIPHIIIFPSNNSGNCNMSFGYDNVCFQ